MSKEIYNPEINIDIHHYLMFGYKNPNNKLFEYTDNLFKKVNSIKSLKEYIKEMYKEIRNMKSERDENMRDGGHAGYRIYYNLHRMKFLSRHVFLAYADLRGVSRDKVEPFKKKVTTNYNITTPSYYKKEDEAMGKWVTSTDLSDGELQLLSSYVESGVNELLIEKIKSLCTQKEPVNV